VCLLLIVCSRSSVGSVGSVGREVVVKILESVIAPNLLLVTTAKSH